jgi:hypothetical protein
MKKFIKDLKNRIFSIFSQTRYIHIILFISISISLFFFSVLDTTFSSNNSNLSLLNEEKKHLRNLEVITNKTSINNSEELENNTDLIINNSYNNNNISDELDIIIRVRQIKLNLTEKIIYYEFIKTITTGFYYGDWNNLNIKNNRFHEKKGEGYISFYKKSDKNYLLNLGNISNSSRISVYFTIKDGEYIDDYLEGNFTFTLEDISTIDLKNESISFILKDVPISYCWEEYIEADKIINLNHTFINLTFFKKFRQFEDYMEYKLASNNYGNVSLEIKNYTVFQNNYIINNSNDSNISNISNNSNYSNYSQMLYENNFEISFNGIAYGSHKYSKNTLNYSIFLTVFCIIEIFLSADFVKLVNTNDQMALNTDLFTILFHIMWTSLVCGVNFFMSLTRKSSSYEYTMPSFCYFSLFSIFLLRILFLAWRARNRDITDMQLFRKKLLRFYLLFYLFLFITLISVKLWYSYFFFTFILFGSTWISQIIYSAKQGTKPPMSYLYILSTSFSKISISFYVKAYKNNIFGYRPNYIKVFIVSSVIIIEAIILCLQKFLGAKFIIPKKFRKHIYNYYKNENEISQKDKETECVICLDKIGNYFISEDEEINNIRGKNLKEKIVKYIEKLKNKQKNKEKYMLTPCKHLFHTKCLESWLNVKNQCPCCRQKIPPLED